MVVSLGPGRFYGSGLPRPWFHAEAKFNDERVDPPPPVLDPLLCWAREAHWSMGGLSFKRHRLQGRIEGSIKKLRAEAERTALKKQKKERKKRRDEASRKRKLLAEFSEDEEEDEEEAGVGDTPSPRRPEQRRRRLTILEDEDTSESDEDEKTKQQVTATELSSRPRRKSARKLGDEFDRVASRSTHEVPRGSDVLLRAESTTGAASSPRSRAPKPNKWEKRIPSLHQSEGSPEKSRAKKKVETISGPDSTGVSPRRSPRLYYRSPSRS